MPEVPSPSPDESKFNEMERTAAEVGSEANRKEMADWSSAAGQYAETMAKRHRDIPNWQPSESPGREPVTYISRPEAKSVDIGDKKMRPTKEGMDVVEMEGKRNHIPESNPLRSPAQIARDAEEERKDRAA